MVQGRDERWDIARKGDRATDRGLFRMKVAILGATSFLAGRCATQLTFRGHEVLPFARHIPANHDGVLWGHRVRPLIIENIGNSLLDEFLRCDAVINCIGGGVQPNHRENSSSIWEANSFAPIMLIEKLAEAGYQGKLITFGSYFELGENNAMRLLGEDEFIVSRAPLPNAYCRSKRSLTRYIDDRHAGELPFEHLHCILTNLYGPGENQSRLIPYIFRQVAAGKPMHFSSGLQQRQYTHVDDVAAWLTTALELENRTTGIFNLTEESVFRVREVIEMTLEFLAGQGLTLPPTYFDEISNRDLSMVYLAVSAAKARKELGWNPSITLAQGIASYHEFGE